MPQNARPIRLPRALRDELAEGSGKRWILLRRFSLINSTSQDPQHSKRKGRPGKPPPLTRKESRKQARQDKKTQRVAHSAHTSAAASIKLRPVHQRIKDTAVNQKKRPASEATEEHVVKKRRVEDTSKSNGHGNRPHSSGKSVSFALDTTEPTIAPPPKSKAARGPTPLERLLAKQTSQAIPPSTSEAPERGLKTPRVQLSQAEKHEDDEIAWLEAKLKLKKGKNKAAKRDEEEQDDEDDLDGKRRIAPFTESPFFLQPTSCHRLSRSHSGRHEVNVEHAWHNSTRG